MRLSGIPRPFLGLNGSKTRMVSHSTPYTILDLIPEHKINLATRESVGYRKDISVLQETIYVLPPYVPMMNIRVENVEDYPDFPL